MRIFISENDRYNAFRAAILNVAKYHNITDSEFKTNEELYIKIYEIRSPLQTVLDDYLEAYDNWFNFYQPKKKIEQESGKEYSLNNKEQTDLTELISAREEKLSILRNLYNNLQNNL
jgi:hypothetical protein